MADKKNGLRRRDFLKVAAATAGAASFPRLARAQAKPILIGHQADITGFGSYVGYGCERSLKAAVDHINSKGGIAGRKVATVSEDTATEVATGVRKFRKLIDSDNVDFVLGSVHSGVTAATLPIANETKTFMFHHAQATMITDGKAGRYQFRVRPNSGIEALSGVDYALRKLGKKWTFLITDFAYGHSSFAEWSPIAEAAGVQILAKIPVPVGSPDMLPYLAKIPADTEVVVAIFTAGDGVRFLTQSNNLGIGKKMARLASWSMIDGVNLAPLGAATEGALFMVSNPRNLDQVPADVRPHLAEVRKLIGANDDDSDAREANRILPSSYYLAPWIEMHLLKESIEKTGWQGKADNEKLVRFLEGYKAKPSFEFPVPAFTIRPQDHQAFFPMFVEEAKGGKLQVIDQVAAEKCMYPARVDQTTKPL